SLVLILWIRLKGVAGPEYARLNTGGRIISGKNGEGALPPPKSKKNAPKDRASFGLSCPSTQAEKTPNTKANRCFEFDKRRQLFIRSHNETLSVVAVCVNNPHCSRLRING